MRYGELIESSITYFHGSRKRFKNGFILLPQKIGYVNDDDELIQISERILEKNRPAHCLPRTKCVYMVDDPNYIEHAGGWIDFVYQVKPMGKVERNDLAWYSEISNYYWDDINDPEAKLFAENYWNGIQYKNIENSLWEYRAASAEIIQMIET